jgi:hypothetical protein
MANVYDFLGDDRDHFMKSSFKVFTDLSGNMQYVGKTQNEKTVRLDTEFVEWFDNTSGVQTLYVKDLDSLNFAVDFSFMQVADPNAVAIAFNADWDASGANYDIEFLGSNPNPLVEAEWRFVGRTRDARDYIIVIRKGVITPNGEWANGAPGQYTEIPVTCAALQDTNITNDARDLAYIMIEKQTAGS